MNSDLISVCYLVFIKIFTKFCQLMTADFQLQIPPLVLEWWLWLDLCATLDSLWHLLSLPHNFAAYYQLNSWSQTPSVAQKSAHSTWPAFNGGGPRSKISCFGGSQNFQLCSWRRPDAPGSKPNRTYFWNPQTHIYQLRKFQLWPATPYFWQRKSTNL